MRIKNSNHNFDITNLNLFFFQEDKDNTSGKESLDDLFPTDEEEQSHSMHTYFFKVSVIVQFLLHLHVLYSIARRHVNAGSLCSVAAP